MADFNQAVTLTLKHEGGFVNNPADPGGATNMGITQRDLPGIDIRSLTADVAMAYYRREFWLSYYNQIDSQAVANKLFDMGVLFGLTEAIMLLQLILSIHADGSFGPFTLSSVNAQDPTSLLGLFKQKLYYHAQKVVQAKPQEAQFFQGWVNRINS